MKLDHIALNVKNISESVEWYINNLGATILYDDASWAMLDVGNVKIALTLNSQHPPHMGFTVDDDSAIPCNPSQIRVHRDGSRYYYQEDPSGNIIEWLRYPEDNKS